jgi:hypothetical protein
MKQSSLFWHHPWGGLLGCWRRKAYRNHILFGAKERETHAQAPAQWNQRDTLTSPVDKRERERSILVMTVRRADWILAGDLFLSAAMRSELASHGTFLRTARQYTRLHLPLKDTSFSFTSFLCFFLLVFLPSFFSASSPLISSNQVLRMCWGQPARTKRSEGSIRRFQLLCARVGSCFEGKRC